MDLHPDPENMHKCSFCDFTTLRITDLWKHKYVCNPSSMISRRRLQLKVKQEREVKNKVKKNLKYNRKACDLNNKYLCSFCGKSFNVKAGLISHEMVHSDVKPYCCSSCPKTFRHKIALNMHERTHTGVKPYKCTVSIII